MSYNWNWWIFFEPSLDGTNTYLMTLIWGACWTVATRMARAAPPRRDISGIAARAASAEPK